MITQEQLANWFVYHAPEGKALGTMLDKTTAYQMIRNAGLNMAKTIVACTPQCADQSAAIRKVREAVMTANAAIACEGQ